MPSIKGYISEEDLEIVKSSLNNKHYVLIIEKIRELFERGDLKIE